MQPSYMTKISFHFFNDRVVRAVWDEGNAKWLFSMSDVVGVLNGQDDYTKNRNYWKYLKNKLKAQNVEQVSTTNQLRVTAPDGKMRLTDVLDASGVGEVDAEQQGGQLGYKEVSWGCSDEQGG